MTTQTSNLPSAERDRSGKEFTPGEVFDAIIRNRSPRSVRVEITAPETFKGYAPRGVKARQEAMRNRNYAGITNHAGTRPTGIAEELPAPALTNPNRESRDGDYAGKVKEMKIADIQVEAPKTAKHVADIVEINPSGEVAREQGEDVRGEVDKFDEPLAQGTGDANAEIAAQAVKKRRPIDQKRNLKIAEKALDPFKNSLPQPPVISASVQREDTTADVNVSKDRLPGSTVLEESDQRPTDSQAAVIKTLDDLEKGGGDIKIDPPVGTAQQEESLEPNPLVASVEVPKAEKVLDPTLTPQDTLVEEVKRDGQGLSGGAQDIPVKLVDSLRPSDNPVSQTKVLEKPGVFVNRAKDRVLNEYVHDNESSIAIDDAGAPVAVEPAAEIQQPDAVEGKGMITESNKEEKLATVRQTTASAVKSEPLLVDNISGKGPEKQVQSEIAMAEKDQFEQPKEAAPAAEIVEPSDSRVLAEIAPVTPHAQNNADTIVQAASPASVLPKRGRRTLHDYFGLLTNHLSRGGDRVNAGHVNEIERGIKASKAEQAAPVELEKAA